jgi:hypothetical protein
MDSALIWYGLGLLLIATLFWAAVWWWLPALFRDRDEQKPGAKPQAGTRERDEAEPDDDPPDTGNRR